MESRVLNGAVRRTLDERDYDFNKHIACLCSTSNVPDKFDLSTSPSMPPVIDQLNKGACGGCSSAGMVGFINGGVILSPEFIYDQTRAIMNTLNSDSGVDNRTLASVLVNYGVCLESEDPYIERLITVAPSAELVTAAMPYRALKYVFVDGKDQIMQTMVTLNTPVVFGMDVFPSFESSDAKRTGLIPMPKRGEQVLGGHDQAIVGWDTTLDFGNGIVGGFKVRNSWGPNVFQGGYEWIPFAYFDPALNYVFDAFVVMKNENTGTVANKTGGFNFWTFLTDLLKSLFR